MSRATAVIAVGIPQETRDEFLRHIRLGASRYDAAVALDPTRERTATVWRRLAVEDAEFRAAYEAACADREALSEETRADYRDELRSVLRARATNLEERSSRFLMAEAATHLPEYAWLRERKTGRRDEASTELPRPPIDVSLLTTDQLREFEEHLAALETLVAIGQGRMANPDLVGEPSALTEGDPVAA